MSAMPVQLAAGRDVPMYGTSVHGDRACWFPIDEAAALMDVHRTTLLRRCQGELAEQGSARRMPVTLGGRLVWHVHARVSPRLVRAAVEATPTGESAVHVRLQQATRAQREAAAEKARLVVAFRAWREVLRGVGVRQAYAGFRATHPAAPALRSIEVWSQRCPSSDDLPGCMAALLDTRGRPREGAPGMSEAAWSLYCELYLDPRQWSHGKCWRAVRSAALEHGWTWPSADTVARTRDKRLTPSQISLARDGQDRWAKKFAAPIEQDPDAWQAGQCWEGDNSRLDFFARVVGPGGKWVAVRPWLTAWIDRRSRRLMGWQIGERADSTSIRRAMLSALKTPGVGLPEHVWIDNGKDFAAASLAGSTKAQRRASRRAPAQAGPDQDQQASALFLALGVRAHFATAYNHNGKARVERFFATVHQDHDREYASWCGSDEGDRPDVDTHRAAVADVMSLPTLEQVRERFAEWIDWYNRRADHAIDDLIVPGEDGAPQRLSPMEFYERRLPALRVASAESLELLWPVWSRPLAVGKQGVGLTIAGKVWRYGATHPALEPLKGTDARVYVAHDPDRIDEVVVYDTAFRFLCRAQLNQLLGGAGVSREDLREAMSVRREQRRRAQERPSLVEAALTDVELAARKARERQVAETNARLREAGHLDESASVPMRLVTTPVDGQAARVAKARKAVGAEHDAMPHTDEGEHYGDILMALAGSPSDGRSTAVERPLDGPNVDLLNISLGRPDEDDGGDILATLGGAP